MGKYLFMFSQNIVFKFKFIFHKESSQTTDCEMFI
jgi:hypothetical protein